MKIQKKTLYLLLPLLLFSTSASSGIYDKLYGSQNDPTPKAGSWEDYGNGEYHRMDVNGNYWTREVGEIYIDSSGRRKVKNWVWVESDELTYTIAWKGDVAYNEERNSCMEQKVSGQESREGLMAIRRICTNKAEKAQKKAEAWVKRWHKVKGVFK